MVKTRSFSSLFFFSVLAVTLLFSLVGMGLWAIDNYSSFLEESEQVRVEFVERRKAEVVYQVDRAIAFIQFQIANSKAEAPSAAEMKALQQRTLEWLVRVRFGADGYLFGSTFQGEPLFTNGAITLGGPNVWDLTDPNGVKIIQRQIQTAQAPEGGFMEYAWRKLTGAAPSPKIAYVRGAPQWGWVIGSGFYVDDVESGVAALKERMHADLARGLGRIGLLGLAVIFFALLAAMAVSRFVGGQLAGLTSFLARAATEKTRVDLHSLNLHEFRAIGDAINGMLDSQDQAEAAIRQSENALRSIFLAAPVGVGLLVDSTIIRGNEKLCEMTGYAEHELVGLDLLTLFAEGEEEHCFAMGKHLPGCEQIDGAVETRLRRKDGECVDVLFSAAPIDQDDFAKGVTFTVLDISERKQASESLQQSHATLLGILEAVPAHVYVADFHSHEVLFANEAMRQTFGPTCLRTPCHKSFRGLDAPCPDCRNAELVDEAGEPAGLFVWEDQNPINGRWYLNYDRAVRWLHGGMAHIQVAMDITERKQAEKALQASEQRFRLLLDDVDMVAVQGYDQNRRVIYWNKASERLYGYTEAEALGQLLENIIIPPFMREDVIQGVTNWVEKGTPIPAGELQLLRKDGSLVSVYSSHVMQETASGEKALYCVDVELTPIKKAHDQLLRAKEQAEAANRAKSEFLANMSHEIRTPLNGILGMLQLMQRTAVNEEQQQFLATALQSSRRLTRLLSDILDLSRVEASKMEIVLQPFSLHEVMDSLAQLFTPSAHEKSLDLLVHVDPRIPRKLRGDAVRLQQVLSNLIGNAIKFTSSGRVEAHAHPLPSRSDDAFRVLFSVTDTGIGIPDDKLDKLFTPFSQVSQGYKREHQGAGLGLSICKRLVDLMGGQIAVESELEHGSTVYFSASFAVVEPVKNEDGASLLPPVSSSPVSLSILLAEDDEVNQLAAKRLAEKLGHTVTAVSSGWAAIDALRDNAFDVVLMDVQMPGLDGVEATKRIRNGDAGKDKARIPIIALTAYAMTGDMEMFLAAGMDDYLPKPMEFGALQAALLRSAKGQGFET